MVKVHKKYGLTDLINNMDAAIEGDKNLDYDLRQKYGSYSYNKYLNFLIATKVCLEYRAYEYTSEFDEFFSNTYVDQLSWEIDREGYFSRTEKIAYHIYEGYTSRFYKNNWSREDVLNTIKDCQDFKSFKKYTQHIYDEYVNDEVLVSSIVHQLELNPIENDTNQEFNDQMRHQ
jgi:hypothetical protein